MTTKNISKKKIRETALKYLAGNRLMILATANKGKPWAATVFFAYDKEFNLYFFSRPETKHCKHIEKNSNVAVAISHDWGEPGFIKGFQMVGQARRVSKTDYKRLYAFFRKRFSWADESLNHVLYQIKPAEVYHINQKVFGHFYRVRVL